MRPAGKGPLESLYFSYPTFTAKPVPEHSGRAVRHSVVIVGAGPIGLCAALSLARYGVKSVVLDRKTTFNDGSRAICIARPSMQILEQIGAVAPFLDKALGWRYGTSTYKGHEVYRLEMPHSDEEKYLPMYNLQQQYIEQFLHDAVACNPLIDMRWASEVTALSQDASGARIELTTPLGSYALEADYVLAADGARSAIRTSMGLRLKGENYEGRYVIADVRMAHDYPTERRAFFEPPSNPGGTVLVHKQPDDIWRIDYQLRDDENPEVAVEEGTIRARVGTILTEIGHHGPWELEWWSIYTANTLCLDDYRHGRVFFIGDSAHIVPIFGVRGLNNGLADAFNIGWKLAYVLGGAAGSTLLDSYSPERRGATLDVFANASRSARFMTPPSRGAKLVREAVLSLAIGHEFARPFANPRQMQPYTYREGLPEIARMRDGEFTSGPACGSACSNARIGEDRHLLELAGTGFSGIYFTNPVHPNFSAELADSLSALDARFKLVVIAAGGPKSGGLCTVVDRNGKIAQRFDAVPGTFYLLRPDLHVAGRWRVVSVREVQTVMQTNLGSRLL